MSDLTFGVKLEGSGSLAGEAKAARDELVNLQQATDNLASSAAKMASQYGTTEASVKAQNYALTETSGTVNKLLDRYDHLSAKLRQLKADFKALDDAAKSGSIADKDLGRVDEVYSKIQQEIKATAAEANNFGTLASKASDKTAFATKRAQQEFMVLAREIMSGNTSRIPGTLSIIAQGLSPVALAVAGVTVAVAAGAYAWYKWGDAAGKASEKALEGLHAAEEAAKKSKHMNKSEQIEEDLRKIRSLEIDNQIIESKIQELNAAKRTASNNKALADNILYLSQTRAANKEHIRNLKQDEQALVDKTTVTTIELAKQNSELWKNYTIRADIAKLSGTSIPAAPSDQAIKEDAASGLNKKLAKDNDTAKILADAKHFDEVMLAAHEDAFTREIEAWKVKEDLLTKLGARGVTQRIEHERAYNVFVEAENEKILTKAAAEAKKQEELKARHLATELAQESHHLAKFQAEHAANQRALLEIEVAGGSSRRREQMANGEFSRAMAKAQGTWRLQDEANYQHHRTALETAAINEQHALKVRAAKGESDLSGARNAEKIVALRKGGMDEARLQALINEDKLLVAKSLAQKLTDLEAKRLADIRALMVADAAADKAAKNDVQNFTDSIRARDYEGAVGFAAKATANAAQHSRAAFEAHKVLAISEAGISAAKGIAKTLADYPFPISAAMAVAQGALAYAQIDAINSQQFGGGGSAPSISASIPSIPSPGYSGPSSQNNPPPAAGIAAPATQQMNLTIIGAKDNPDKAIMSYNSVLELIQQINVAGENGHKFNANLIAA